MNVSMVYLLVCVCTSVCVELVCVCSCGAWLCCTRPTQAYCIVPSAHGFILVLSSTVSFQDFRSTSPGEC